MPKFAANLSMLFTELPFLDRFQAARAAGFEGVEFLFPYDFDALEIRRALDDCGLPLVLFNTPAGDWQTGDRGFAAMPDGQSRFLAGLTLSLEYAAILRPFHIHIMSGVSGGHEAESTLIYNLKDATKRNPNQSFLIEPLNPQDVPGYFLGDFAVAKRVIETVNTPNLNLQFDAYHSHLMRGDVLGDWAAYRDLVRHIQIAGVPGRNEPLPSEIDYLRFFEQLAKDGYQGFVSAEYHPKGRTDAGLNWTNAAIA